MCHLPEGGGGGGAGMGGHSGTEGGFTCVTYLTEKGVVFKTSALSAILLKKGTFMYPGTKYGG